MRIATADQVNAQNKFGQTPLHLALKLRNSAAAEYILQSGKANLYLSDTGENNVLHLAASSGYFL